MDPFLFLLPRPGASAKAAPAAFSFRIHRMSGSGKRRKSIRRPPPPPARTEPRAETCVP